jgi:SOS-response transcriptional repressor LexA
MLGLSTSAGSRGTGRVVSIGDYAERRGEYVILTVAVPGESEESAGVLLLDVAQDDLHLKLRRDWEEISSEDEAEVLRELEADLSLKAREMGGAGLLQWLENNASQTVRISDREAVAVRDFAASLNRLYRQHVHSHVRRFQTHLPVYSLEVAAGPFLTNPDEVEAEEWVETPENLRLDESMFVAHIRGRSMEPKIPDGSLCVFRRGVVGSRNGRLVLVRNSELADENRYTVKRYRSEKAYTEEGFQHTRIRLESLNPEYPSWDLDPEESKYQIVAEFVSVLS